MKKTLTLSLPIPSCPIRRQAVQRALAELEYAYTDIFVKLPPRDYSSHYTLVAEAQQGITFSTTTEPEEEPYPDHRARFRVRFCNQCWSFFHTRDLGDIAIPLCQDCQRLAAAKVAEPPTPNKEVDRDK